MTQITEQQAYDMGARGAQIIAENERQLFEAWMRGHCWALSAEWDGSSYRSSIEIAGWVCPHAMRTRQLWAAWRDRAALAAAPSEAQTVYCGCGDQIMPDDGARCGTCVSMKYTPSVAPGDDSEFQQGYAAGSSRGHAAGYRAAAPEAPQQSYIARMEAALSSESHTMPDGLSREEQRQFILSKVKHEAPQQSPDELEVTAADLEAIRRFKLEQEGEAPEAPQQEPVACRFVDRTGDYVYSTVIYPDAELLYVAQK